MSASAIAEKVKKLLALAESDNPHEAAAAAGAAERLMQEHRLTQADLGDAGSEAEILPVDFEHMKGGLLPWKAVLCNEIARMHGCACLVRTPYGHKRNATIVVFGVPSDVEAVRTLYAWTSGETDRLVRKMGRGRDRRWQTSYRLGCVTGITDAMEDAMKTARSHATSTALARVDDRLVRADAAVESVTNRAGVEIDKDRPKLHLDVDAFREGERDGRDLHDRTRVHGGRVLRK